MRSIALIFLVAIYACSSTPTQYAKSISDKQGYTDKAIDNNLMLSTFKGNSSTKKDSTELYAKFRAIEVCSEKGKPYTHILLVKDKTFEKQISQTTTNYPAYYYGASPYYGGYGGVTTNTSNESYTYPVFDVYFECVDRPFDARMSYKVLSQSQMKDFVKDLQGAVQIEEILPDSPNKDTFKVADIIVAVNGTRVENILGLYQASRNAADRNLEIDFFREGVKKKAHVKFLDVTELVGNAQAEIKKMACKKEDLKDTQAICK
jgi:hypothetical protein